MNLPDEIVVMFFRYIKALQPQLSLFHVCRQWRRIAIGEFGRRAIKAEAKRNRYTSSGIMYEYDGRPTQYIIASLIFRPAIELVAQYLIYECELDYCYREITDTSAAGMGSLFAGMSYTDVVRGIQTKHYCVPRQYPQSTRALILSLPDEWSRSRECRVLFNWYMSQMMYQWAAGIFLRRGQTFYCSARFAMRPQNSAERLAAANSENVRWPIKALIDDDVEAVTILRQLRNDYSWGNYGFTRPKRTVSGLIHEKANSRSNNIPGEEVMIELAAGFSSWRVIESIITSPNDTQFDKIPEILYGMGRNHGEIDRVNEFITSINDWDIPRRSDGSYCSLSGHGDLPLRNSSG